MAPKTAVYDPPRFGLPYLAVSISAENDITAYPFATKLEAEMKAEELLGNAWAYNPLTESYGRIVG